MLRNAISMVIITSFLFSLNILNTNDNIVQVKYDDEVIDYIIEYLQIENEMGRELPRDKIINFDYLYCLTDFIAIGIAFYNEDENNNPIYGTFYNQIETQPYDFNMLGSDNRIALSLIEKYNIVYEKLEKTTIIIRFASDGKHEANSYNNTYDIYGYEKDTNRKIMIIFAIFPESYLLK